MKVFQSITLIFLLFLMQGHASAQAARIISGKIYTLQSKANGKVLDVSNASLDNNASVDGWVNTGSDAERWVARRVGRDLYTFTNVASGKLLHIASSGTGQQQIDQCDDTGNKDVRWIMKEAENGYYYIQSAGASLSLQTGPVHTGDSADGAMVYVSGSAAADAGKWSFQQQQRQDAAPTAAIADKSFEAWFTQYQVQTGKGFWGRAEMMEILLDAFEVTKDPKYITRFDVMYHHFLNNNKADWMYNKYNDDITWAVLFCVRAYLLTGNKTYLQKGKEQFDKMYARASTDSFGGGLIWYETKTSKNACINGPAMVASCYLAQATGDSTYYNKAIALYTWSKLYLFNSATGKVNDNVDISRNGHIKISNWSSTYNQGTYLGAATMLYQYTKKQSYFEDAKRIARYTRDSMYNGKVIDNEDGGEDLPGFKGIFARYARMYTLGLHQTDLVSWMVLNAKIAYNNRNSKGLIQTKWGTRTTEIRPPSDFGCSTAVSLLINCLPLLNPAGAGH